MAKKKELLVIIPAYNEEENLGNVIKDIQGSSVSEFADILVLNDASTDHTAEIAKSLGAECISHIFNLGYGCGLQIGYKYALIHGYEYVIQMDADGQHDVSNVERIYAALKDGSNGIYPDIVLGSRFMEGSGEYRMDFLRRFAFGWFGFLIWLMTGIKVHDPTTGLQGLSRRTFTFYASYRHFDSHYPDANMLVQMMLLGFNIKQIPATMHQRLTGTSMHSGLFRQGLYMMLMTLDLMAVWLRIKWMKVFTMDMIDTSE